MESQALIENEWTSYYPVNAHNSGSVRFCMSATLSLFNIVFPGLLPYSGTNWTESFALYY